MFLSAYLAFNCSCRACSALKIPLSSPFVKGGYIGGGFLYYSGPILKINS